MLALTKANPRRSWEGDYFANDYFLYTWNCDQSNMVLIFSSIFSFVVWFFLIVSYHYKHAVNFQYSKALIICSHNCSCFSLQFNLVWNSHLPTQSLTRRYLCETDYETSLV